MLQLWKKRRGSKESDTVNEEYLKHLSISPKEYKKLTEGNSDTTTAGADIKIRDEWLTMPLDDYIAFKAKLSRQEAVVEKVRHVQEKLASIIKMWEEEPWKKQVVSSDALLDFTAKELKDALTEYAKSEEDLPTLASLKGIATTPNSDGSNKKAGE